MKQRGLPKLHTLHFTLWISFVVFSVSILLFTWAFQSSFLRVYLNGETEDDLTGIGEKVSDVMSTLCSSSKYNLDGSDEETNTYVDDFIESVERDNLAVTIFLLDDGGAVCYPTNMVDADPDEYENPDSELFSEITETLATDGSGSLSMRLTADAYIFAAALPETSASSDSLTVPAYIYINYSTVFINTIYNKLQLLLVLIAGLMILLSLLVALWISQRLTKPIKRITDAARRMAKGDFNVSFQGEYSYAEVDTLAETLDYAKTEIGKSTQLQREVLANVSHDLKTPLTMIKAYASMIQEISGGNPEKRRAHTQVIIDETDRLTDLINDVLSLSKINSGMDSMEVSRMNLSACVREVTERFGYLEEEQYGYRIETEIEDELYADADPAKMNQVVYNLIGNAVSYTGDDKFIRIRLVSDGGVPVFSVTDTGIGLTDEEKEVIWDRYYCSTENHKRPVKGTGLGLSIVKSVLEKHGFQYGVESRPGHGSTFYVRFEKAEEKN